ncbi:MAG: RHS repeat protein [Halioglobus sp.]|nr:RHS repeat protein [Halioglobus sp.]
MTASSGRKEWYDGSGRLLRIMYPNGERVNVAYFRDGLTVTDAYGAALMLRLDAQKRVISMRDPDGEQYRYGYTGTGKLAHVSYPDTTLDEAGTNPFGEDNPYRSYHYGDPFQDDLVTGITDENRERYKTVAYDVGGRVISRGFGDGKPSRNKRDCGVSEDRFNPSDFVFHALGRETVYALQGRDGHSGRHTVGGLPSASCLAEKRSRRYFEESGWLQSEVDSAGAETRYTYYLDAGRYGLVRTRTEAFGTADERHYTLDWDPVTRKKIYQGYAPTIDGDRSSVRESHYVYEPHSQRLLIRRQADLKTVSHPYKAKRHLREWRYQYSYHDRARARLRIRVEDGPRKDVKDITTYEYSTGGNLIRVSNPLGRTVRYHDHNGRGQPGRVVDANGRETLLTYTARGFLDTIVRDRGGTNAWTDLDYDNVGNLTRITRAGGSFLAFSYDAAHRLSAVENRLGERIEIERNKAGKPVKYQVRSDKGSVQRVFRGELNGRQQAVKFCNQRTRHAYADGAGIRPVMDAKGRAPLSRVKEPGWLLSKLSAKRGASACSFYGQPQPARWFPRPGFGSAYAYDGFGNITQFTDANSEVTRFAYDEAGNRTVVGGTRGVMMRLRYDELNRLVAVSYPASTAYVHYRYGNWAVHSVPACADCNGRLSAMYDASGGSSYIYDARGNVVSHKQTVSGAIYTVVYAYDVADSLLGMIYPSGRVVEYTLDPLGRINSIETRENELATTATVVANVDYLPFGPVARFTCNQASRQRDRYIADRRNTGVHAIADAVTEVPGDVFTDDVKGISTAFTIAGDQVLGCDVLDRSNVETGICGAIFSVYDEIDNATYNALGRRVKSTLVGAEALREEHYVYDLDGKLIAVLDAGGATIKEYIYLNDLRVATLIDPRYALADAYSDNAGDDQFDCAVTPVDTGLHPR